MMKWKDWKETVYGLFKIISQHLTGGTQEMHVRIATF
jgi:hypothetical protein